MRIIGTVTVFLVVVLSCNTKSNKSTPDSKIPFSNIEYPIHIKLSDFFTNASDTLKLSDIADSISYIKLETTKESLLGNVRFVQPFELGYLIVDNTESLFLFDKAGQFKWKLNKQGRGPAEYESLPAHIGVDNSSKEIIIPGWKGLLVYDFNGQFLRKISLPFYPSEAIVFSSGSYVTSNGSPNDPLIAQVLDKKGKVIKQFINYTSNGRLGENGKPRFVSRSDVDLLNNNIFLSNKDTIWLLNSNLDLEIKFIIDGLIRNSDDRYYYYNSSILSKSLMFFGFFYQLESFIYNCNSHKVYKLNGKPVGGIIDDIDQGTDVKSFRGDGYLISDIIYPSSLIPIKSKIRLKSDLLLFVDGMKEDDNPIIRIIKLIN
jgi:hypothetical protein